MNYYRLRFGEEASRKLSQLKGRTGLTPNILARIGFCISLNDPTPPNPADYHPDSDREIDRHTLTGAWDSLFVVLIKERCQRDGFGEEDLFTQFRAHMNRGVLLLDKRVRSLTDLIHVLPQTYRSSSNGAVTMNGQVTHEG